MYDLGDIVEMKKPHAKQTVGKLSVWVRTSK